MTAQRQPDIDPQLDEVPHDDESALGAASPFDDGDVDGLFFPDAGRQEVLDQFAHLLRYGPSLLLLYGDQGVGKHYLADRLLDQLDPDLFDVAMIQADVLMNPEVILAGLSASWHSRAPLSAETLQQQLVECAGAADDESRVLLLMVRHSQFLDEGSVELLSLLLASCAGLPVKVLLVLDAADPEDIGQLSPLFDQIPDHFRALLPAFTHQQTAAYLGYRLHTGGLGRVHFSEAHVDQIFNFSLGNAARINRIASELLLASLPARAGKTSQMNLPWMHISALLAVAALLLVLVLGREDSADSVHPVAENHVSQFDASQLQVSVGQAPQENSLQKQGPEEQSIEQKAAVKTVAESVPAKASKQSSQEDVMPASVVKEAKQEVAIEPKVVADAVVKESIKGTQIKKPLEVAAPPQAKTKAPTQALPKTQPVPKTTDPRTAWIMSLPSEHYALQLLGAQEKDTVDKFLALYPSVQKLSYYKTRRNGAPWYVVVQASFPSYESAKAAVAKLPQKLQKQGPWIRKIEAIQKDLKN